MAERLTVKLPELVAMVSVPFAAPGVAGSKLTVTVQEPAAGYYHALGEHTMPQIRKADRVEQAFQRVLDDPAAEQALGQPALKPLLDEAAD